MKQLRLIALALAGIAIALPARASSSAWHEAEGGRVRLLTAGRPDTEGRLRGVLQIDLKPGWKTYWRDPGGSGVPPTIDVSASPLLASAEIEFPTPAHHFDGISTWAGYDKPVDLPVTFHLRASGTPGLIDTAVFLGICETICVPVQAKLSVDTAKDADDPADAAAVTSAWSALPAAPTEQFGAKVVEATDKTVTIETSVPPGASDIDLFLAGSEGYMFGAVEPVAVEGQRRFIANILTRPKNRPVDGGLHYTLSTSRGAVSGLLPYF